MAAFWMAGIGFALASFSLRGATWPGGAGLHTVMEVVATLLALIVGIIALVHYYSRKNNAILFVGTGFLGTAFLDGYHAVVTSEFLSARLPSGLPMLAPWSWVASRLFLSALLCLSVLAWARERRLGTAGRIGEQWVYGLAGALTLTCFVYFAFIPLPRAYYPEIPVHRPEELLPAVCFLAALIGYLRKGRWRSDMFEHWLVLSLVVSVVGQIAFMSVSGRLFDPQFHAAHLLKTVSYACVLTGLLISMYSVFRRAEANTRVIAQTNARLRKAMLERENAELELRDREARFRDIAESMSDWIWATDAELRFSYHSDRLREVTGIDPATLLGTTRREMGRGDTDEQKWQRHLGDLDARRPFRDFRYTFVAGDGRTVHFSTSGKPVFDGTGRFLGYRGTGSDITAHVEAEERARSAQERLALAVEGLSELVVLFDADDRIVLSNQAWRDLNREVAEFNRPGVRFEDHLRANVTAGLIPEAVGREEEWLAWRMTRHRDPRESFEVQRQDGRWILVSEQRLPDGGTVLIITDISERKRAEAALRESEQRFRGAIETLQEGFALYDADDRLVLCNDEYRRLQPGAEDILDPGMPFDLLVRTNIERGTNADAVGREEEHIRERLAQHRNPAGPIVRHLTNGGWFIIKENRTPDGGIVVTETDITELKRAEKELRDSEARFRAVVDNSPTKIHIKNLEGRYLLINRHSELLFGVTDAEAKGKTSREIFPKKVADSFMDHDQEVIDGKHAVAREEEWVHEGCARTYLTVKFPIPNADGAIAAVGSIGTDITQHKATEAQLRQAQKMESIGRLTGGVAHDFNNLLAVILGNLQLLERRLCDDERQIKRVQTAIHATQRGAELVKRLLAYSRQQVLDPSDVDAYELLTGMKDLLSRALGETVDIELRLCDDARPIYVDAGQLENALLNLAVNAHDAMPNGGRLVVETANIDVDDRYAARHPGMVCGQYLLLTVADTGTGIPPDVLKRVFEPFFTTKEVGKGTGLGLSMIYGFAKQSGAYVDIRSKLGQGTAVDLYLPVAKPAAPVKAAPVAKTAGWPCGTEKILVVEDEPGVRETTVALLKDLGYRVLEAADGPAALAALNEHQDVALLFTDIVMPGGMNGFELGRQARARLSGVSVLYTTGYTWEALGGKGDFDDKAARVISKPYRNEELARRIRNALDERMEMA